MRLSKESITTICFHSPNHGTRLKLTIILIPHSVKKLICRKLMSVQQLRCRNLRGLFKKGCSNQTKDNFQNNLWKKREKCRLIRSSLFEKFLIRRERPKT